MGTAFHKEVRWRSGGGTCDGVAENFNDNLREIKDFEDSLQIIPEAIRVTLEAPCSSWPPM